MKLILTPILFLLIILNSCKEEKNTRIVKQEKTVKKNLSNNTFREKVLPKIKHKNDRKKLLILLNQLDKENLTLCDFVKREFEIDDSCFAIAKEKYPDPEMQVNFMEVHDKVYEIAHKRFLKQTKFNEHDASFLVVAYSFDEKVKNFCGKF